MNLTCLDLFIVIFFNISLISDFYQESINCKYNHRLFCMVSMMVLSASQTV